MENLRSASLGALVLLVASCWSQGAEKHASGTPSVDVLLNGHVVRMNELKEDMQVPLNTIVTASNVADPTGEFCPQPGSSVTIAFKKADVNAQMLAFLQATEGLSASSFYPYSSGYTRITMKAEHVLITIEQGLIFHLRNDIPAVFNIIGDEIERDFPFSTEFFNSHEIAGVVKGVQGSAFASTDQKFVKEYFPELWTTHICSLPRCILGYNCIRAPDGSYVLTGQRRRQSPGKCATPCVNCEPQPEPKESDQ